jgi:hypothetical protein
MDCVDFILAAPDTHRSERTGLGSLNDAVDILAFRDRFDRGLFCFSSHDVKDLDGCETGSNYTANDNQFIGAIQA